MTKNEKREIISKYLDELFPNPKCELIYHNDYELLIAIVLSAQTTDKRVNMVTPILFSKYPTLEKLSEAPIDLLEEILKPIGSFRKKAVYVKDIAYNLITKYQGVVPTDREKLEKLKGVGRKTINVFLSEYYNYPAIAVDTHVERISKRLRIASKKATVLEVEEKLQKFFPKDEWAKRHLQLVLFGRYYCKAVKPDCSSCPLKELCRDFRK
ncbi:MAG: endonuclease III [Bacilli bacterium]|nr:endonuclease III [Bacilli bacterium]